MLSAMTAALCTSVLDSTRTPKPCSTASLNAFATACLRAAIAFPSMIGASAVTVTERSWAEPVEAETNSVSRRTRSVRSFIVSDLAVWSECR